MICSTRSLKKNVKELKKSEDGLKNQIMDEIRARKLEEKKLKEANAKIIELEVAKKELEKSLRL